MAIEKGRGKILPLRYDIHGYPFLFLDCSRSDDRPYRLGDAALFADHFADIARMYRKFIHDEMLFFYFRNADFFGMVYQSLGDDSD